MARKTPILTCQFCGRDEREAIIVPGPRGASICEDCARQVIEIVNDARKGLDNILPQKTVRAEIEKGKGSQFDPVFADLMLQIIDEDTEYKLRES